MLASLALIAFGIFVEHFHLAHKLPDRMPMRVTILELSAAFSTYARDPRTLAITFGLSIVAHFCIFLSFYFSARAFGQFAGLGGMIEILAVLPVILTIASLPISLSGVGVREGLFQKVLSILYGTPESLAVMISITGFLMVVFWGLVGGCVYLVYRPTGGLRLDEVQDEVQAIEGIPRRQSVIKATKRPRVIANFALTADGKVSTRNLTPTGFTSKTDKTTASGDPVSGRCCAGGRQDGRKQIE